MTKICRPCFILRTTFLWQHINSNSVSRYFFFVDVDLIPRLSLSPRWQKNVRRPERSFQRIFPSRLVDTLTVTESTFRLVSPLNQKRAILFFISSRAGAVRPTVGSMRVSQTSLTE